MASVTPMALVTPTSGSTSTLATHTLSPSLTSPDDLLLPQSEEAFNATKEQITHMVALLAHLSSRPKQMKVSRKPGMVLDTKESTTISHQTTSSFSIL